MKLPPEILRYIFRFATAETDVLSSTQRDEADLTSTTKELMQCKVALSLVSHIFHDVADEFLFESISIRQFYHIRPLVKVLQQNVGERGRGWWCRHLDLELLGEAGTWDWGRLTLWGFLPACPRLIDLRCCIVSSPWRSEETYCVSLGLLQTIASLYGSSLRRLDLTGHVRITHNLTKRLLACLPVLEVCRFRAHLQSRSIELIEEVQFLDRVTRSESSGVEEYDEYEVARLGTRWPSPAVESVHCPHLHTLELPSFTSDIASWHLPCLTAVGIGFEKHVDDSGAEAITVLKLGLVNHTTSILSLVCDGASFDVWAIIDYLPNLKRLEFSLLDDAYHGTMPSAVHANLETIVVNSLRSYSAIWSALMNVVLVKASGFIPNMLEVGASGKGLQKQDVQNLADELQAHGVTFHVH